MAGFVSAKALEANGAFEFAGTRTARPGPVFLHNAATGASAVGPFMLASGGMLKFAAALRSRVAARRVLPALPIAVALLLLVALATVLGLSG